MSDTLEKLKSRNLVSQKEELEYVSTGNYALNYIISGKFDGGVAIRRITQFIGESSAGKSAFVTTTLGEAQKKGYYTLLYDAENTFTSDFAQVLGLDPAVTITSFPETIEGCFQQLTDDIETIRASDPDTPIVAAIDSLAVLCSEEELQSKELVAHNMLGAMRAKALGAKLRKIDKIVAKNNVALLLVNQFRSKVGVMFGSPDTKAAGGRSLDYYLSTNIKVARTKKLQDERGMMTGIEGYAETQKNKCFRPFLKVPFNLSYDTGLSPAEGVIDVLQMTGHVTVPAKGWYQFGEMKFRKKDFVENHQDEKFQEMLCVLDQTNSSAI